MKEKTLKYILPTLFIILTLTLSITVTQVRALNTNTHRTSWIYYNISASSGVFYNFDKNGILSIVLPNIIIERGTLISSPYPKGFFVATADLAGNNTNQLILYGNGKLLIYNGLKLVGSFNVPNVLPIKTEYAYAFNNVIIWKNSTYVVSGNVSNIIPIANENNLFVAFESNGYLKIADLLNGKIIPIYKGLRPIYGALGWTSIYIATITNEDNLVIVKYPIDNLIYNNSIFTNNPSPDIGAYTILPQKVLGFNPITDSFYVEANNKLYSVSVNSLLLISEWKPIAYHHGVVYLYNNGKIAIYDTQYNKVMGIYTLPIDKEPLFITGYYNLLAIYSNGTYVHYNFGMMYVIISGSQFATAGNPYNFDVYVFPSSLKYTILVDGLPTKNTTIIFDKPGLHTIKVIATNGIINISRIENVYVEPRPLTIYLKVIKPPEAYSVMKLILYTSYNNIPVNLSYNISYNGKVYSGISNKPITIPVGVPTISKLPILVKINSELYGNITRYYEIPLMKIPLKSSISFLGNGTFQIDLTPVNTSIQLHGKIIVILKHKVIYNGSLPAIIKFNKAGNYTLVAIYYPINKASFPITGIKINIRYLGNITKIPNMTNVKIVSLDHIINKTKIIIKNRTVTTFITETTTQPLLSSENNLILGIIFFLVIGIGIGFFAGSYFRKHHKEADEIESNNEEESGDNEKLFSKE